ncbi:uncharacterized protein ALTATR162_LOCUS9429 [Alternaria atra]|uniref:Uncharacterized protein n=1 Tax=Alternaria atra TaxID=119953 RepID=A0A8J2I7E5_9PLEO|nr:uncharacterized protein ALTATR162_LOCUS9429 [Alternaria atra]CAG5180803.1 unnamed protein product [Alternaria atra]
MEPPSESVPTWSWFASPIYLRWVTYFADDLYSGTSQLLFFTKLSQFRWCKLPIDHVPPTAYHDFDGLQITLELATYTTTVLPFWSHDAREMNCESLGTQLASLLGVSRGDVTALYICDDLKEIDQPPTKIYIALVGGGRDKDKKCHLFEGLALAPGTEKETYKRVGYWSGSVRCEDKYTPVFRRAIYSHLDISDPNDEDLVGDSESEDVEYANFLHTYSDDSYSGDKGLDDGSESEYVSATDDGEFINDGENEDSTLSSSESTSSLCEMRQGQGSAFLRLEGAKTETLTLI